MSYSTESDKVECGAGYELVIYLINTRCHCYHAALLSAESWPQPSNIKHSFLFSKISAQTGHYLRRR